MNIGAIIVLAKLFQDAVGVSPSVIGPPAPNGDELCYTKEGKFTWLCYLQYVDPAASYSDYQDYLKGV
jgi:hypothetical protein